MKQAVCAKSGERNYGIDLFRIVSMFMVVVLLMSAVIYLICTAIEAVRFYLFKLLKIKDRLLKLEQRLIGDLWE